MKRRLLLMLVGIAVCANATTPDSSKFEVKTVVNARGTAVDMTGAIVTGLELEIACPTKVVRATTGSDGKYDFGEIGPGKCRIAALNPYWKAPKMRCDVHRCQLQPLVPSGENVE